VQRFQRAFYSGMSSSSDLLGAIDAGVDIGVVAGRLSGFPAIWLLMRHLDRGSAVFIDSGAFGERASGTEPDWESVLSVYERLAHLADDSLERLYVVAPDKVGDQAGSLGRLRRYGERVRNMIDAGVQVIVPYQVGALSGADLHRAVQEILSSNRFIVGVPANRDAMPAEMLRTIEHPAYHILGRVQKNAAQAERLAAIAIASPNAVLTADAAWILSRMQQVCDATRNIRAVRRQTPKQNLEPFETARRTAVRQTIKQDARWAA